MKQFFPGVEKDQLPGGVGWALEVLTLTTHSGTHLDSPYHYHPSMDKGSPALTVDEIPLEWCFSDGVLLDFRHKGDGERIRAKDLENELDRIGYEIKPLDIVLIQTGADAVTRLVLAVVGILAKEVVELDMVFVQAHAEVELGHGELVLFGEKNTFRDGAFGRLHRLFLEARDAGAQLLPVLFIIPEIREGTLCGDTLFLRLMNLSLFFILLPVQFRPS